MGGCIRGFGSLSGKLALVTPLCVTALDCGFCFWFPYDPFFSFHDSFFASFTSFHRLSSFLPTHGSLFSSSFFVYVWYSDSLFSVVPSYFSSIVLSSSLTLSPYFFVLRFPVFLSLLSHRVLFSWHVEGWSETLIRLVCFLLV